MNAEDYPGRGELPDALAFVSPNRARAYIVLETADDPLSAAELKDRLGCSQATAYRCLHDLEDVGLVTDATRVGADAPPKTAYLTVSLPNQAALSNGGADR